MDRLLVVGCAVAAVVGLADATISREADLAAVFATVLLLLVLLLARLQLGRPTVVLRRDVAGWLRGQSRSTRRADRPGREPGGGGVPRSARGWRRWAPRPRGERRSPVAAADLRTVRVLDGAGAPVAAVGGKAAAPRSAHRARDFPSRRLLALTTHAYRDILAQPQVDAAIDQVRQSASPGDAERRAVDDAFLAATLPPHLTHELGRDRAHALP